MKKILSLIMTVAMVITVLTVIQLKAEAETINTGITGLTAASEGNATWTSSSGSINGTASATVNSGCLGDSYEVQSGTLILTNNTENRATLSMSIELSLNGGSITIDSEAVTARGTRSFVLDSGSSIVIELTSAESEAVTSISLDDISLIVETNVTVTFLPPSNGSYQVDGEAITSPFSITKLSTDIYTLLAAANASYKFMGWFSETSGTYFSYHAQDSWRFTADQSVRPVFVSDPVPVFKAGAELFTNLPDAISYAQNSGIATIVLISSGVLPAGDYTIPNGITLLLPCDEAHSVVTTTPIVLYNTHDLPTPYSLLTIADGASITVESGGAISVAGVLCSVGQMGNWNGCPSGPSGRIRMENGSSMTLKSGSNLYCWGYIYGGGTIVAESGSAVYEAFQIKDWRGGNATSNVVDYAFLLNQYYIQNIEVALTIEAGAVENLYSSVNASGAAYPMGATLVGPGGMFELGNGYIIKDYIEDTDRLNIEIHGNVELKPMTLTGIPMIGSISTSDYVLPITSNLTVDIQSGTVTVTQDVELLPSVEINIAEGAAFTIDSEKRVYVYDNDDWGNFTGNARLYVIGYSVANGTAAKRTAAGLVDARIDVNGTLTVDGGLFTSQGGAAIVSSGKSGKVVFGTVPEESSELNEMVNNKEIIQVSFTAPRLCNSDGTYEQVSSTAAETYEYCSVCDKWSAGGHEHCTISWKNWDGTLLDTTSVMTGEMPVYRGTEDPSRDADDEYLYTFAGWSPQVVPVAEDTVYTAVFTATAREYDGPEWTWTGHTSATAIFTAKDDSTHSCSVTAEGAAITSEVTVASTCTEPGEKVYTATVTFNGQSYHNTVTEEIVATGHDWDTDFILWQWNGITAATATFQCQHDGSHKNVIPAVITQTDGTGEDTGYTVYTAIVILEGQTFTSVEKVVKEYRITFVDDDGETVLSPNQTVYHGGTVTKPANPTRKFYTFKGWYLGETLYDFTSPVSSDIELRARWSLNLSFSVTATMKDNFNLNFYIKNLADEDASDVTVYWVFDGKEYEQNVGELSRYDNERYRVVLAELFAFQMTLNVSIQVKCGEKTVMTLDTFCLRDYFEYLVNNESTAGMRDVARAALDYGAAAQQYFDGRTYDNGIPYDVNIESLANQNTNPENTVPSADKPANSVSFTNSVEGLSVKTASLIFGTEMSIKVYFTYTGDTSELSISCDNGKAPTAAVLESDGRYSIYIRKICSYELYKDYTITFADDTGTAQLVYSPYAYAAYNWDSNTSGLSWLVRAMVAYGEKARLLW